MQLRKTAMSWLGVGLSLQLLVACSGVAGEQSGATASTAVGGPDTKVVEVPGNEPPVRVSRGFFEAPMAAEVRVQPPSQSSPVVYPSGVQWVVYAPTDPAPSPTDQTGPVLADFRDRQGCAVLEDADDLALCFRLMGDVDSVGLNAKDVTPQGVVQWLDRELGGACGDEPCELKFLKGSKEGQRVTVSYLWGSIRVDVTLLSL